MKKTVRNRFVPLMPRVSSSAIISAITLMSSVDTTVNLTVNQKACVN